MKQYIRNASEDLPWCHGNNDSYRVTHIPEHSWLIFMPAAAKYAIGPRGALYKTERTHLLMNPDAYRRGKPGPMSEYEDQGIERPYIDPPPWGQPRWCEDCGFLFEGGWKEHIYPQVMYDREDY